MIPPSWWAAGLIVLLLVVLLARRPAAAIAGFLARTCIGMVFLWLFRIPGAALGLDLGVNPVNGAVLGALGVPGFGLLLLIRWILR